MGLWVNQMCTCVTIMCFMPIRFSVNLCDTSAILSGSVFAKAIIMGLHSAITIPAHSSFVHQISFFLSNFRIFERNSFFHHFLAIFFTENSFFLNETPFLPKFHFFNEIPISRAHFSILLTIFWNCSNAFSFLLPNFCVFYKCSRLILHIEEINSIAKNSF